MQHAARNPVSISAIDSTSHSALESTRHAPGNASGISSAIPTPTAADAGAAEAPRQKSLVAFLRAIQFRDRDEDRQDRRRGKSEAGQVETYFAQLKPRARQRSALAEEACLIRSAN